MLDKEVLNLRSFACTLLSASLASIEKLLFPVKVTSESFLPMETEVEGDSVPISIVGEIILVLLDFKVVVGVGVPVAFLPIVMVLVVSVPISTVSELIVAVLPFIVVDVSAEVVSTLNTSVILLSIVFSTEKVVSFT